MPASRHKRSFHNRSLRESRRPTGPLIAAANRVSATSACNCAKIIFFGKRDLAFGINLPERSEIWKTFLGASDGPCSRQAACGHAHCARVALALPPRRLAPKARIFRRTVCLPGRAIAGFYRGKDTGKRLVRSRE
jgi:hypothetical protein